MECILEMKICFRMTIGNRRTKKYLLVGREALELDSELDTVGIKVVKLE
jgi:hypothetical protein